MKPPTMKIIFKDDTEMLISKTTLKRNSGYFIALFRSGMKETLNNCVDLRAMNVLSAKAAMNFLKYDKLQLDINNVVCVLEAAVYFEIPSLQEKCFKYLSMQAVHCLDDIIELSQQFHETRLEDLAFEGAAQNFQIAINCKYRFSLPQLRTILASKYMTVSSEYDLAIYIAHWIHGEVKDTSSRKRIMRKLMKYVSLASIPLHRLLSLHNWPTVRKNSVLKWMLKETYSYHMKLITFLPLLYFLRPRRTKWNIFACNEHIIEQVDLVWPDNDKSKFPNIQLNRFDGKGKIREVIWAYGFLYVFVPNGFLRFDPAWKRWSEMAVDHGPVEKFTLCVFKDFIYKIGGQLGFVISARVERFSPRRNSWSDVCLLDRGTCALSAVVFEGCLVIIGGLSNKFEFSKEVFVFDSIGDKWLPMEPMNFGRYGHQSVVLNGCIYVFGGSMFEVTLDEMSEVFNPEANQWTLLRFDTIFYFSYIWTVDEYLFAIEGFPTSRRTNLARIDLKTRSIIKYEEPLPFTLEADIKYMISMNYK